MDEEIKRFEMTDADLLGHKPEELACNQCGGVFCGHRVGRVFRGKPLILCSRKDEVKEILGQVSRRKNPHEKGQ